MKKFKIQILCIVTSLFWFSLYTYVSSLPNYAKSLGAEYVMIGLITGSYGVGQLLLRVPIGIYSDIFKNRKIFIILGIIASIISSLGMLVFKNALSLLLFRFLSGFAAAAWVAFTVLFTSYYLNGQTSKSIGIINSFNFIGTMLATFTGGIISSNIGPMYTFLESIIAGVLALILSFFIYEEKQDKQEKQSINTSQLFDVLRDKNFMLYSLLAIISQLITFGSVFAFTPIVAKNIGASEFQIGLLTTFSTAPLIIASIVGGTYFTDKIGEKNTIKSGFVLVAIATIIVPFTKSISVLYITQFLGGFGRGIVFPLLMSLSIKNVDYEKRASAMGFFQCLYSIGMFMGPFIAGIISKYFGIFNGFVCLAIMAIIGAVLIN